MIDWAQLFWILPLLLCAFYLMDFLVASAGLTDLTFDSLDYGC